MYQYDNAPAHTDCLTVNVLAANRVQVLDWPPLSPDILRLSISGMSLTGELELDVSP